MVLLIKEKLKFLSMNIRNTRRKICNIRKIFELYETDSCSHEQAFELERAVNFNYSALASNINYVDFYKLYVSHYQFMSIFLARGYNRDKYLRRILLMIKLLMLCY